MRVINENTTESNENMSQTANPEMGVSRRSFTTHDDGDSDSDSKYDNGFKRYAGIIACCVVLIIWNVVCFVLKASGKISGKTGLLLSLPTLVFALLVWAMNRNKM